MIRHISLFRLLPDCTDADRQRLIDALETVGETCPLVSRSEVGSSEAPLHLSIPDGPVFGDVVQILDFDTKEDLDAYPGSEAHLLLREKTDRLIEQVFAMDYAPRA